MDRQTDRQTDKADYIEPAFSWEGPIVQINFSKGNAFNSSKYDEDLC